jgi:hypothetical protein
MFFGGVKIKFSNLHLPGKVSIALDCFCIELKDYIQERQKFLRVSGEVKETSSRSRILHQEARSMKRNWR